MRLFGSFIAAIVLACCPPATIAKTFKWTSAGDTTTLDPHGQDEGFTNAMNNLVYERLLQPGRDMSPTPWLATSWRVTGPGRSRCNCART